SRKSGSSKKSRLKTFIAALRTPPWLPSGWGCRGRRLSKARETPDRRNAPLRNFPAWRMPWRGRVGRETPKGNSARHRDDRETFGTQWLPLRRCATPIGPCFAGKPGTWFQPAVEEAGPIRRAVPLRGEQGLARDYSH